MKRRRTPSRRNSPTKSRMVQKGEKKNPAVKGWHTQLKDCTAMYRK
jgi:hypothetical protein